MLMGRDGHSFRRTTDDADDDDDNDDDDDDNDDGNDDDDDDDDDADDDVDTLDTPNFHAECQDFDIKMDMVVHKNSCSQNSQHAK